MATPVKTLLCALLVAFILWAIMFSPLTAPLISFWPVMSLSAVILTGLASFISPPRWRRVRFSASDVAVAVAIAAGLWLVFWVGDAVSSALFPFARPQVHAIYGIRESISPWGLTLLLLFLIGPAEEYFWRGCVQEQLARRWGATPAFFAATALYTAVHIPSCNFMLVMASLVAGGTWGLCYRFFPSRFAAIVISHALWDVAIFVWFPIH